MENQNTPSGQNTTTINVQVPSANDIASRRPLIPASFSLVILFFFFTFCIIKCGGENVKSVTGIEFVTGTEIKGPTMFSNQESKSEKIPPNIWAIFAFGAAIVGLGAFLMKDRREALIGTSAGVIGVVALLILQFGIKTAIDDKTKGNVVTEFQFPYWGALIAFCVAGFISYLRMQQTGIIVTFAPPATTNAAPTVENAPQPPAQRVVQQPQSPIGVDIVEWLSKNRKTIPKVLAGILVLFGIYYFFIRHDPENDGKKAANASCDCTDQYDVNMVNVYQEFLDSFSSKKFKKRQDAITHLQTLQGSADTKNTQCNEQAQSKYTELKNRYLTNEAELKQFDFAYDAQRSLCSSSNQDKVSTSYSEVQNKIATIRDPEPDIEKIKSDLLGQKILGWNFDALSEFKKSTISKVTRGSNLIEYILDLQLAGYTNPLTDFHDAQIVVTYSQGDDGWAFNNVKEVYITRSYNANIDEWTHVHLYDNCTYSIIHKDQKFWIQEGSYGTKYMGGPGGDNFYLQSSDIYIMSREDHPIDIIIKYVPNN